MAAWLRSGAIDRGRVVALRVGLHSVTTTTLLSSAGLGVTLPITTTAALRLRSTATVDAGGGCWFYPMQADRQRTTP